jgi:HEPN domain-containing protein
MSEVNDPRAWVKRAEEDFELARASLRRKKPFTASACFHAQQCAEKYMKALLVSKGTDFPKTHDLLLLNNLCSNAGLFLEINPKFLNTLTDFAVRTRYPGEEPILEEAKEALGHAKLVRELARNLLGI